MRCHSGLQTRQYLVLCAVPTWDEEEVDFTGIVMEELSVRGAGGVVRVSGHQAPSQQG